MRKRTFEQLHTTPVSLLLEVEIHRMVDVHSRSECSKSLLFIRKEGYILSERTAWKRTWSTQRRASIKKNVKTVVKMLLHMTGICFLQN